MWTLQAAGTHRTASAPGTSRAASPGRCRRSRVAAGRPGRRRRGAAGQRTRGSWRSGGGPGRGTTVSGRTWPWPRPRGCVCVWGVDGTGHTTRAPGGPPRVRPVTSRNGRYRPRPQSECRKRGGVAEGIGQGAWPRRAQLEGGRAA